ncbi:nucleotide-binding protein [Mesorhizobium sp. LMG 17147]|uniref:TIR domain-containing protein n=1 Tax=Mesorhizobium sp. LMG 17147 TaxID=2963091 RepID=UPI0020CA0B09|nr:nucleotide-binding protein [Mesorhizobium sp. LMG 17147]MCP9233678.1 nucleotide-binding protein [Mesorhizobium sp. LMG 17147]
MASVMNEPGYKASRKLVLGACNILASLGHSDFDQLLLEIGIDGIDAGRDKGGRHSRAMALATYAVDHPSELTPEGDRLDRFLIQSAGNLDREYPLGEMSDVSAQKRMDFWIALEADGFKMLSGKLVRKNAISRLRQVFVNSPPKAAEDEGVAYARDFGRDMTSNQERALSATVSPISVMPSGELHKVPQKSRKVFVVHGRDKGALNEVELFLRRLKLEPIILHKNANAGRSILTKFQEVSDGASFAVVVMMPEDVGGLVGATLGKRARQNVVFELGFFIGKLGAKNVCALMAEGVEKPSDFDGIGYVQFGDGKNWEREFAKELREAGVPFDPGDVL